MANFPGTKPDVLLPALQNGEVIRAAGGVLWRSQGDGAIEVALIHRPRYGDWSLPKGKLRSGEHPLVAACREVTEETGIHPVAGRRLEIEHYGTAIGPKTVEYWAMQGPESRFTPTDEVDRVAWLGLSEARNRLDHEGDSWAIDALGALEADTDRIAAVLLVRNGCTVPVTQWAGDDRDRPLSPEGQEQAEVLHRMLLAFMPSRLLAAPQTRFMDTLRPLGEDLGLAVEPGAAFAEDRYINSPLVGLAQVQSLARTGPMTTLCASETVIRHLIADLADESELAMEEVQAENGSAWALFFSGTQLAAADYYRL